MSPHISVRYRVHCTYANLSCYIMFCLHENILTPLTAKVLQLYYLLICNKFGHFYLIAYIFSPIGKKRKIKIGGCQAPWQPTLLASLAIEQCGHSCVTLWRVPRVADGKIKKLMERMRTRTLVIIIRIKGTHLPTTINHCLC